MTLFLFGIGLAGILIMLAVIDFNTRIIPNILVYPLIAGGLAFSLFLGDIKSSFIGAGLGYMGFVLLELGYKSLRGRAGIGRGDAKLLAAGGAWCGWYGLPFIILISSGSGLVHALLLKLGNKSVGPQHELPFGPHLAIGIFLTWLSLFVFT